jgi:putative ABC transport system permease protein
MLKNYLKTAIRNLLRHKLYSFINMAGLALGIAGSSLMLLFILDELSYERHNEKADRIYAVFNWWHFGNYELNGNTIAPAMAPALKEEYPEIAAAVRSWIWSRPLIIYNEKRFYEEHFVFADPEVFDVFTFSFIAGDPRTALREPYSAVLTAAAAQKYFGAENPLGKRISFWDNADASVLRSRAFNGNAFDLTVTGVVADFPFNSNLEFDFLASFSTFGDTYEKEMWSTGPVTYLLLNENASARRLEAKLPAFVEKHIGQNLQKAGQQARFFLVPLKEIRQYFTGGVAFIFALSALAVLILLVGSINFMNLATARSAQRAKEVGVRKVVGAGRRQLVAQFLGESTVMAFAALPLALVLIEFALPQFNAMTGKRLALDLFHNAPLALGLSAMIFLTGMIAGSYPALFLSRFQAESVLKGSFAPGKRSRIYRFLVVFQFAVAVFLLIAVAVLQKQMEYARTKNLGFDKDQIVVIPNWRTELIQKNYAAFRNAVLQHPRIMGATVTAQYPGYAASSEQFGPEGATEKIRVDTQWGDHDFIKTFGFTLVAGRDFSHEHQTDADDAIIINEAAVQRFGWASPQEALGKKMNENMTVAGIVKDFHIFSLHQAIGPAAIRLVPVERLPEGWSSYFVALKIRPENTPQTIDDLKRTWESFFPTRPFVYSFLDDQFARFYEAEQVAGKVASIFSFLIIAIAGLGLFGLAAYAAERRTKEIGIRKVLGSSISNIVALLSKEFVKLVLIANAVAWPMAYFALNQFLQIYAYRISISWLTFVWVGSSTFIIALLTVSTQAIKAALANPVEALRYE